MKQELFAQEYMKANGNGTAAVRKAYPNVTTERAREVMSSKLQKNKNIQEKINELKAPIFNSLPELGEMVLQKLKAAFIECESHRDMDKLGRTLLEVGGFLSNKGINMNINAGQGPAINIHMDYDNSRYGVKVMGLEDLSVVQMVALQAAIEESHKNPKVVERDQMIYDALVRTRDNHGGTKAGKILDHIDKQTVVNSISDKPNNTTTVSDGVVVSKTGGDFLHKETTDKPASDGSVQAVQQQQEPTQGAEITGDTPAEEKNINLAEEGSSPLAPSHII